jgi:glycerophosphoryl diester phosphodiesterase
VSIVTKVLTIAHRGASQVAPENTIPAITKALEAGAEMLALEVQKTIDNVPMVMADVSLDRTTNGSGRVARTTAKEIQALDAGSWFNADFKGTKVPTLADVIKSVGTKGRLMLTLPETRTDTPWAKQLLEVLKERKKPAEDVLVFSDSDSLKQFRDLAKDFSYCLALGEKVDGWLYLEKAEKIGLKVVRPFRTQIDSVLVGQAHTKNLQVFAYFANDLDDLEELVELKVDGIITGRPERLKSLLNAGK